jgi:hypothetical protein
MEINVTQKRNKRKAFIVTQVGEGLYNSFLVNSTIRVIKEGYYAGGEMPLMTDDLKFNLSVIGSCA